ncbi:AAA family ATPase [[Ruminococcus] torques]|uniref:AAA family ATPase n=1 Tax=[Ruminococcus] torques TaxID=33039 RepID=UPI0025A32EFF|nr:AAA family ATPase [[Ruminococcus] torques]MDM8237100.1 AAA family ATPase [[Ruminococcus] torques]
MEQRADLLEILDSIHPADLNYQEWVNVGMALKHEGYTAADWDRWSQGDPARYHSGECFRKWGSFYGASEPVTAGTIVQLAIDHGWMPERDPGHELNWDDEISREGVVVDSAWLEGKEIHEPDHWNPAQELIKYLETLFEAGEHVGYVTQSWEKTDEKGTRWLPSRGNWDRTAGQLIQELNKCNGDIGAVVGDYNPDAGAWIRFNPLDGKDCTNENVTDFRYALVESDDMELEKQNALIRELELPVAALVFSGKKSLHAIVRIEAADMKEYKKRVEYLYSICKKNELKLDTQNKNPSRLSRMPGVTRNGKKQFLADTNIGKESWDEWVEWIESVNDDLPDPESLESVWENLPELSPCLIDGVLRKGHKMLIAGPSKAGKSFLQIELCISIAEGKPWLGWKCARGRVMYVNLELDRASCLHRFRDVYDALGWQPEHLDSIDIWNLRGKSVPMDKLAPKLIRRASKKDYVAIIIDPIYKVITGDENSADQMANFCNQFDKVCTELGCAVIYCHHHSKGSQGGKKSMDRASGSGVFARDPDALLDLIELETTDSLMKQEENKAICQVCIDWLKQYDGLIDGVSQDDMCSSVQMLDYCREKLKSLDFKALNVEVQKAVDKVKTMTAWRIEGTLREFPKFQPVNLWFDYPVHREDESGALKDIQPEDERPAWQKGSVNNKKSAQSRKEDRKRALQEAVEGCNFGEVPTVKAVSEYLGISERTVRDRIKEHGGYTIKDGEVHKKVKKKSAGKTESSDIPAEE